MHFIHLLLFVALVDTSRVSGRGGVDEEMEGDEEGDGEGDEEDEDLLPQKLAYTRVWSSWKTFCPVSLHEEDDGYPREGSSDFAVEYAGRVFLLENEEKQKKFLDDPKVYLSTEPQVKSRKLSIAFSGPNEELQTKQASLLSQVYDLLVIDVQKELQRSQRRYQEYTRKKKLYEDYKRERELAREKKRQEYQAKLEEHRKRQEQRQKRLMAKTKKKKEERALERRRRKPETLPDGSAADEDEEENEEKREKEEKQEEEEAEEEEEESPPPSPPVEEEEGDEARQYRVEEPSPPPPNTFSLTDQERLALTQGKALGLYPKPCVWTAVFILIAIHLRT